jgi:hypothetical protein
MSWIKENTNKEQMNACLNVIHWNWMDTKYWPGEQLNCASFVGNQHDFMFVPNHVCSV